MSSISHIAYALETHYPTSNTFIQVIIGDIKTAAMQMYLQLFPGGIQESREDTPEFILDIPTIHLAFSYMQNRFNHFSLGSSILPSDGDVQTGDVECAVAMNSALVFQEKGEISTEMVSFSVLITSNTWLS